MDIEGFDHKGLYQEQEQGAIRLAVTVPNSTSTKAGSAVSCKVC